MEVDGSEHLTWLKVLKPTLVMLWSMITLHGYQACVYLWLLLLNKWFSTFTPFYLKSLKNWLGQICSWRSQKNDRGLSFASNETFVWYCSLFYSVFNQTGYNQIIGIKGDKSGFCIPSRNFCKISHTWHTSHVPKLVFTHMTQAFWARSVHRQRQ